MPAASRSSPFRAVAAFAVLAAAFCLLLALGTWQVQRLQWKDGLLAQIEERSQAEPIGLAEAERRFSETGDIDYVAVRASGTFVHGAERHFFTTWQGQSGYSIHTPLQLDDGRFVFVNRGFVPFERKDPVARAQGQVGGRAEIIGLARNPVDGKPSFIVPDNDPAANIFYWKDLATMAATAGLPAAAEILPFLVDAGPAPNPGGLPVGGVTIVNMPNNHLQYAVTWYGLAAALAAVAGVWYWRRWRLREAPRT